MIFESADRYSQGAKEANVQFVASFFLSSFFLLSFHLPSGLAVSVCVYDSSSLHEVPELHDQSY